jgi:hypothetical protein
MEKASVGGEKLAFPAPSLSPPRPRAFTPESAKT